MCIRFIFLLLFLISTVHGKYNECYINGELYKTKGNYTKALESYMSGVDKNITDCMVEAAKLYSNEEHNIMHQPELALKILHKALNLEPYRSLIHYNLGSHYYNLGHDPLKRDAGDIKSKYHFLFAYYLGDEDAYYYVKGFHKLKKRNGYIEEVLDNTTFNTQLIAKRLVKFSQGKISITSKYKDTSVVLNTKHFKILLDKDKIRFYGRLDYISAKEFGQHIKTIQKTLYIDIPNDVIKKTDNILTKLMLDSSAKFILEEEFSDILLHNFTLMNKSKVFTYRIEVAK